MSNQAPTKSGHCAFDLRLPPRQTAPLIFSSPHSGRNYPVDFVAASDLDMLQLRRSEDAFVDEIFAAAPDFGTPLLRALFPRAFIDANREAYELDPEMFDGDLPQFVQTKSARITAGLGTIPRIVADGTPIYKASLDFAEAQHRIETHYLPYHQALSQLIENTCRQFGAGLLIDCHSMPSAGAPGIRSSALKGVDMVIGDRHGRSCASAITDLAEQILSNLGYRVQRNRPYAGGFITRHYGNPAENMHAIQIEINRALYMDERMIQRGPGLANLIRDINQLIQGLCDAVPGIIDAVATPLLEAAE